jgi:hypothetical protein
VLHSHKKEFQFGQTGTGKKLWLNMELPLKPLYMQEGCSLADAGAVSPPTAESDKNEWFGYYVLAATILFTVGVFLFEVILDFRQRCCYQKTGMYTLKQSAILAVEVFQVLLLTFLICAPFDNRISKHSQISRI